MPHATQMSATDTGLLVIDVQEKLLPLIPDAPALVRNVGFLIDAARLLVWEAASRLDKGDAALKESYQARNYAAQAALTITDNAVQVLGGHGYIRDHGMEQYARDARISMIYEGTNGIQALDLVGRKLPEDGGRLLTRFLDPVQEFLDANTEEEMEPFIAPLQAALEHLQIATGYVMEAGMSNHDEIGAASVDYLRLFGLAIYSDHTSTYQ